MTEPRGRRAVARALALLLAVPLPAAFAAAPAAAAVPSVQPGTYDVVAGDGDGDGGPATGARLDAFNAAAYAPDGDLLVADSNALKRVDAATGLIADVGGRPFPYTVRDVAVAADGTVYFVIADTVERIEPDGTTTVVATAPAGVLLGQVAVAPDGDVVFGGSVQDGPYDHAGVVHRVTGDGVTRVAGGAGATAYADGGLASDLRLRSVYDLEFTASGDLLVLDQDTGVVRRIAGGVAAGAFDTVAGSTELGAGVVANDMAVGPDGDVYLTGWFKPIRRFAIGGPVSGVDTGGERCDRGLAVSSAGTLAAWCPALESVALVPGDGTVVPYAGGRRAADGTPAPETWFDLPEDVAVAPDGTAYVLDAGHLRSLAGGVLGTVATGLGTKTRAVAVAPDGTTYVSDGTTVRRVQNGTGVLHAGSAAFGEIASLAADAAGNVYAGVTTGCGVHRVDADGVVHAVPMPPCATPAKAPRVAVGPDGRLVVSRDGCLYVADDAGVPRRTEPGWSDAVAVTPDGVIHGTTSARLPSGDVVRQHYPVPAQSPDLPRRLAAAPGGTLLGLSPYGQVVRLTPAAQQTAPAVTGLVVTPGPGTLTLSWDAVPQDTITEYVVRVRPGTEPPTFGDGVETRVPAGTTTVTLREGGGDPPGLRGGEPYAVSVWAVAPAARGVPATATAVPAADTTPPPAPPGLAVTYDRDAGSVTATWDAPVADDLYDYVARLGDTAPGSSGPGWATWVVGKADATYAVTVAARDVYGNVSEPATGTAVADFTPPAAVTGLTAAVEDDALVLRWDALASDATRLRVAGTMGVLYHGVALASWSSADVEWGARYDLAVTVLDAHGNESVPALLTVTPRIPAVLTLTRSAATVTYGRGVTLASRLTSAATGLPVAQQRVELWSRAYGAASYVRLASAWVSAEGRVSFTRTPVTGAYYQLRTSAARTTAVRSAPVGVSVRATVAAALSAASVPLGRTAYVTALLRPWHAGAPLTLERYVPDTGWQPVARLATDDESRVRFAVRPARVGTYAYRVRFAGDTGHLGGVSPTVRLAVT